MLKIEEESINSNDRKTFKKKHKESQDQYVYWAGIRDNATSELHKIIKKTQKLEEKYFEEHPEKTED